MNQRKFKHKKTGDIVESFSNNNHYKKHGRSGFTLPKELVENSNDWIEIKEYPIGTKVKDTLYDSIWIKKDTWISDTGSILKGWSLEEFEKEIGKRFRVMEEEKSFNQQIRDSSDKIFKSWEKEIKKEEKNWEITAFRNNKGWTYSLKNDGLYYCGMGGDEIGEEFISNYEIYSVKVFKDESTDDCKSIHWTEFKLGDLVRSKSWSDLSDLGKFYEINKFRILNNELEFAFLESIWYPSKDNIFYHKPKPLFQLPNENGKMIDIFHGDNLFWIDRNNWKIFNSTAHKDWETIPVNFYFPTEKVAKQYIDNNKKIYSKQDILDALKKNTIDCIWRERFCKDLNINDEILLK